MAGKRIVGIDDDWVKSMRQSLEAQLVKHLRMTESVPRERLMYAWHAVANDHRQLAMVRYAAGDTFEEVRSALHDAARAHLQLTLRRQPDKATEQPTERSDYATGNSRSTYLAICMALIARDPNLAKSLARNLWDPPNARYIGPESVLCTTEQHDLAYALRHFLLDESSSAKERLAHFVRVSESAVGEYLMIRGLLTKEDVWIKKGLRLAITWHDREVVRNAPQKVPDLFLNIPALGLVARALDSGLLHKADLPNGDMSFPCDLIAD
jgi:hypothetical protein